MPLDFSGYVPGIPNMGPKYVAPTIIQLIQGLQTQINALRQVLGQFSDADYEQFKTDTENALDGLQDSVSDLETDLGLKEDKSNKVTALPVILQGDDQHYFSTGAVCTGFRNVNLELAEKQDISRMESVIDPDNIDPTTYPSVQATKDYVQNAYNTLEFMIQDVEDYAATGATYDDTEELRPAKMANAISYGALDANSTATNLHATVPGIDELRDGAMIILKNGVITSASGCTLNINNLGAKPIYSSLAAATRVTTAWNSAYTMLFVYDEDRVAGGCWVMYYGIDNNTNTIGYQLRTNSYSLPMKSITYRYRLLFTSADGAHFVPANNSTSTNATSSRTVCQDPINPHGSIVYYGTTASVAAGSRPAVANLWQQYLVTLGYSFNRTGAALTLTSWTPVYVKAAPQTDGSAIIDSTTPFTQALPTTNDGFIYIFLGVAISATQIELTLNHPIYYNDGTALRIWTGPVA